MERKDERKSALRGKRVGVAITGSFCTFDVALSCIAELLVNGAEVQAILSFATAGLDTKFGTAQGFKDKLAILTGKPMIQTIPEAEPIGPGRLFDILLVLPATGNTLAKLAAGIADTPAAMAVKSHLRNSGPVVLAVSSNDALGTGAKNIGHLLNANNVYFVPFGQDDPEVKPRSMVFKKEMVLAAVTEALKGRQVQPILAM